MRRKLQSPGPRACAWPSTQVHAWMRARLIESGGDPSAIPDEPVRFMRPAEVMRVTSLSRTTLWRRTRSGEFPAPVPLRSARAAT